MKHFPYQVRQSKKKELTPKAKEEDKNLVEVNQHNPCESISYPSFLIVITLAVYLVIFVFVLRQVNQKGGHH